MKKNKIKKSYLIGLTTIFVSCMILGNVGQVCLNGINGGLNIDNENIFDIFGNLRISNQEDWITNGSFSSTSDPWYSSIGGDTSDINASYSNNAVNYEILGDSGNFTSIGKETYLNSSGEWIAVQNEKLPQMPILLNSFGGNSYDPDRESYGDDPINGLWCAHDYDNNVGEGRVYNSPSIHFKKNYSIGDDLSDYQVTSISLNVSINGTVCSSRPSGGGLEVPGDPTTGGAYYKIHDFVRYYVIISDTSEITQHEMGYFKTNYLGQDLDEYNEGGVNYDDLNNTILTIYDEDILIAFLTDVFEASGSEFTITLGIDIYCETNTDPDYDHFKNLSFTEFNFTFTYEKKMNRYATVSWNQDTGKQLDGSQWILDQAILNFKYKSNQVWPTSLSPNTEIRALINNRRHTEIIKLGDVNSTWQQLKSGSGYDVTSIFGTNETINVTIQVILLDNFELNSTYILSIDDVSLDVTYSAKPGEQLDTQYELWLEGDNRTDTPSCIVTLGDNINITFIYMDDVGGFLNDSTVQLDIGTIKTLTKNDTLAHYSLILNSTELHLGENFLPITASQTNYTTIEFNIIITVNPLDTDIQLLLNDQNSTITKSRDVTYGQTINITAQYRDIENLPATYISNATLTLTGYGDPINLTETPSSNHYNITIDSTTLGIGITYLLITAQKENFSTQSISFKIEVQARETFIDEVFMNVTETTVIDIPWNEIVNITATYNDSLTNNSITGADLQVEGMGYRANFSEDLGYPGKYLISINTSVFNVGINYLSITGQKENYSIASQIILISVSEKETNMEIYLNRSLQTTYDEKWAEHVNITVVYEDLESSDFLDNATVELKQGSTLLKTLSIESPHNQYSALINTTTLQIGVNTLTIYAKQENYTLSVGTILINVFERDTDLEIFLNQTSQITIEIAHGEWLNISAIYTDIDLPAYINDANVSLKDGSIILHNFTPQGQPGQYNLSINTSDLGLGVSSLTVYAKAENYSTSLANILINVLERDSEIISYLNGTLGSTIEFTYGELLNITALYKDSNLLTYIDGANLSLRDGNTILYNFSSHPNPGQYNITINVGDLGVGFNILTIYANKDNYSIALKTISITVTERDTYFQIFLEGNDKTSEKSISVSSGQTINITIYYRDLGSGGYIDLAEVRLLGENMSLIFNETMNYYNYTLNTSSLEVGVSFLSISAYKENYTQISEVLTIIVREKAATYELFLNGDDKTTERAISLTVNQTLLIKLNYNDSISGDFISGATLNLTGGGLPDMNFYDNGTFYWISINTTDLNQGVNFLNILAQANKYEAQSILITVNIGETATNMTLFLDGEDITTAPSKKIQVNQNMTFTVDYINSDSPIFITNATVLLFGEGLNFNFTENAGNYTLEINSNVLNRGVNFLTIYAFKNNYEPHSIIVTIEVIEKATDLEVFLNGINKTDELGIDVTIQTQLNVTIKYFENGTSSNLENATISITGAGILDTLSFSQPFNHYWIMVNTSEIYYGMRLLTITAEKNNYQTYTVVLRINVIKITTQINTTSGVPNVEVVEGTNPSLKIILKDSFFNKTVTGAAVSYSWLYGQGLLTDTNGDGVYEIDLTTAPPGTYTVRIFADAGDDYYFTPYEMTVTITAPPAPDLSFLWLLLLLSLIAIIIIAAYATAYQYRFKIPRQIRLLRKYKKSLKNPINPKVEVFKRNTTIKSIYDARIDSLSKNLKEKEIKLEEESVLSKDMDFAAPTK